jgi:competence protein ComEA
MSARRLLSVAALFALLSAPAFAQLQKSQPSTTPAPAATPARPAAPAATTPGATTPVAKKVNLNTATAAELDGLPQIGPARAKAIMDARTKEKFKNWDDFVKRNVVPSNAEAAIKDLVSF